MQDTDSERRLTAILIADVTGYSRLMRADELGTRRRLKAQLEEVISPRVAARRGRIVNAVGDSLLVEFPSIVEGLECAVDIQRNLAQRNLNTPPDERLYWRIGINFGDVVVDEDEIYGNGVNLAARLEILAEPGGICVSEAVFSEVKNKLKVGFESLGEQRLKNIADPVHVYRLKIGQESSSSSAGASWADAPQTILDIPSVAVLPFANLTANQTNEHLANGLTEDLITYLSMSPEFFVIARTSSFSFDERPHDLETVGRQLGVRYLVLGSLQQDQNRFRVSVQLIEATTNVQLWAGKYDRENAELMEVRDEITHSIAATLMTSAGQIAKAELKRQSKKSPEVFDAYDHYLKAREYFHQSILPPWEAGRTASDLATQELLKAIEMSDPLYGSSYAALGWQHAIDFEWNYGGDQEMSAKLAFENAKTAVRNAPDDHMAHWIMGWAYLFTQRNHVRAMSHYNRARELNVGDSRLLAEMAQLLIFSGEYEQAIAQLELAIQLNPFREQWYDEFLAWAHEENGQPGMAIEILSKLDELEGIWSHAVLARAYAQTGQMDRFQDRIEILDELTQIQMNERFTLPFWEKWVRQKCPYKDDARAERIVTIVKIALERTGAAGRLLRKLAAIMYADVAGYSRLTGEDEEGTHRRLSEYLDFITGAIEQNQGKVVHYAGDAVLADFGTVTDAVTCATSIQSELSNRNQDLSSERKVQFRIGVNLGEVIVDRNDIYGDGVNVAARLESLAEPGGICISEAVRSSVGTKLGLEYEFMGERELKNIAGPVRAYKIVMGPGGKSQIPH